MKELRDFIDKCEQEGELHRIKAEVDWNLELGHVAKLSEERKGPALLFENVKGYDIPVLTSAFTTTRRFAIALGMPLDSSICDMAREWMQLTTKKPVKAKLVDSGPVCEMVIEGKDVDIEALPVPFFNPLDGGRFIGTAVYVVVRTKKPDGPIAEPTECRSMTAITAVSRLSEASTLTSISTSTKRTALKCLRLRSSARTLSIFSFHRPSCQPRWTNTTLSARFGRTLRNIQE